VVEPSLGARVAWKHEAHLKGRAKLVLGAVKRVTDDAVELEGGAASVPYDYLVLAPGCGGGMGKALQATLEARQAHYEAEAARIAGASSLLVVGGGATGVELAAEIASRYRGKKVTLVQSHEALVPLLCARASEALKDELSKMGVRVLTGAKVPRDGPGGAFGTKTDKGDDITADAAFDCTGSAPATAFLRAPGGRAGLTLTERGFIVVTKALAVADTRNVFALGDAAETGDAKQGYLAATNQVPTVVANILTCVAAAAAPADAPADAPPPVMKDAPTGPNNMMLVTLGPHNGLAQFSGDYVVAGWWMSWLPTMIKSKGLFIDKVRGEHGV
jgi:NADH dehydrogenase FAD-containing subunit